MNKCLEKPKFRLLEKRNISQFARQMPDESMVCVEEVKLLLIIRLEL